MPQPTKEQRARAQAPMFPQPKTPFRDAGKFTGKVYADDTPPTHKGGPQKG